MLHLEKRVASAKRSIDNAKDISTLDFLRIEYFGKKGYFTALKKSIRNMPQKDRSASGTLIHHAKKTVQDAFFSRKNELEKEALNLRLSAETIDVSLPGRRIEIGGLHPITKTINRIETFFSELGFSLSTGPEIEDDYHNFSALNIPGHHPARADHDTFWFDKTRLLRTQTSCIQIRAMKNQRPPIRIISSGRVYRNDCDQTHTPMFHQMEGLVIDKNISFSNLKRTLYDFLNNFFEKDVQIRFRPSYFPFTEPSAEVDVMGKCRKWLEVLGCGMVHPNVMCNVCIDPDVYSGFAFGMGIERLTMLRYGVTDVRSFFENDLRFLKQFK